MNAFPLRGSARAVVAVAGAGHRRSFWTDSSSSALASVFAPLKRVAVERAIVVYTNHVRAVRVA